MTAKPKYKSYPKYPPAHAPKAGMRAGKDSGIEWLGKIPKDWDTLPLKSIIRRKQDKDKPYLQLLSVYRDYGVIPKDSRDDNYNRASLDLSNYRVVEDGDLVLNKMKTWQGSLGISEYEGIVSPAYYVCSVSSKRLDKKYLHYLLRSKPYIAVYASLSKGIRPNQWDLPYDNFKQILVLVSIDIKSGRGYKKVGGNNLKRKKSYAMQICMYIELLQKLGLSRFEHGYIHDIDDRLIRYSSAQPMGERTGHCSLCPWSIGRKTLRDIIRLFSKRNCSVFRV